MSTFTPEVKSGILMRDGHQCLMSGAPGCRGRADHDPNHRLNRGMGGSTGVGINDPSNGCAICGACNIGIESIPELAEEARRRGVKLEQGADPTRVRDAAQAWLQQRAGDRFGARLAYFLQRTGLTIRRWRLSSAATRWGSCTSDGTIMLNWRLIHFAPDIIDYVIAHELAHLREMNHSQDFWTQVGHILPDFEKAKQALRRHDPAALPRF